MKRLLLILICLISIYNLSLGQDSSNILSNIKKNLSLSGYVDAYISYDNDKGESLRKFSYMDAYRNEFKINIAQATLNYNSDIARGTVTIHFGDMPVINWPENERYLQEANIGFSPGKNLWVDAGYFITHIGAESLKPIDNYFSTTSLCAYYEPNYQSGIRVSYSFSDKLSAQLHFVNGYNVLADNNKNKSFGLNLDYKVTPKTEITFNNLTGNEAPSSSNRTQVRVYNNVVLSTALSKKTDMLISADYCWQSNSKLSDSTKSAGMFSGFVEVRYRLSKKVSFAVRGETFQDKNAIFSDQFMFEDGHIEGMTACGMSFDAQYSPAENSYVRLEVRDLILKSGYNIFNNSSKNTRTEVVLSSGLEF